MNRYDVIILGAGASGLMCARELVQKSDSSGKPLNLLLVEGNSKPGKKLLCCGGGMGNITNLYLDASYYQSANPHFVKSALNRYTQYDVMEFFESHGITWNKKEQGRLYTNEGTKKVLDILQQGLIKAPSVTARFNTTITDLHYADKLFFLQTTGGVYVAPQAIVATGGVSFPALGATNIGYSIAKKFDHAIVQPRPALSPMVLAGKEHELCKHLAGVSVEAELHMVPSKTFTGPLLFTHFGISGLVVLQSSLYWQPSMAVTINLMPHMHVAQMLEDELQQGGRISVRTLLRRYLPKKLVDLILTDVEERAMQLAGARTYRDKAEFHKNPLAQKSVAELSGKLIELLCQRVHRWKVTPIQLKGYAVAEVTAGGVDTGCISSKTMESRLQQGLYFIGEVLDITGELGGYNLQWAWSSAMAVAHAILS